MKSGVFILLLAAAFEISAADTTRVADSSASPTRATSPAQAASAATPTIPAASTDASQRFMNANMINLESNGASRGGGNGLVCFPSSSAWPNRLGARDNKPHPIPDEALSEIQSVTMLDVNDTILEEQSKFIVDQFQTVKTPIPPLSQLPQVSAAQWANDRAGAETLLNTEFERYIGRYKQAIPTIYQALEGAQSEIPVSALQISNAPIQQLNDFDTLHAFPRNCVLSTIFNQWRSPNSWLVDARLYFHPKHSLFSQITAMIHERVYWVGRKNFYQFSNSFGTYFFTRVTLTEGPTYKDAVNAYNQIFDSPGIYVSLSQIGPALLVNSVMQLVFQYANGVNTPYMLGFLYTHNFQSTVLNTPVLDEKTRQTLDKNFTHYFVDGVQPTAEEEARGWPIDYDSSPLPLP